MAIRIGPGRGGFQRPFTTSEKIRDIISDKGVTHLQEVHTELVNTLKSATPKSKVTKKYHLPSRDTTRMFVYAAKRLGLIQYTGLEDDAIHKSGANLTQQYNFPRRKYFSLAPGAESSPYWDNLWDALGAIPSAMPAAEGAERVEAPIVERRKPILVPIEPSTIIKELASILEDVSALVSLTDAIPSTISILDTELDTLKERTRALVTSSGALVSKAPDVKTRRKEQERLDTEHDKVVSVFNSVATAAETINALLEQPEDERPQYYDQVRETVRQALSDALAVLASS